MGELTHLHACRDTRRENTLIFRGSKFPIEISTDGHTHRCICHVHTRAHSHRRTHTSLHSHTCVQGHIHICMHTHAPIYTPPSSSHNHTHAYIGHACSHLHTHCCVPTVPHAAETTQSPSWLPATPAVTPGRAFDGLQWTPASPAPAPAAHSRRPRSLPPREARAPHPLATHPGTPKSRREATFLHSIITRCRHHELRYDASAHQ